MGEHNWYRYDNAGDLIEIIIRDGSGGKIESYKFHIADHKKARNVISILKRKYNFLKEERKDKDIDWLK